MIKMMKVLNMRMFKSTIPSGEIKDIDAEYTS